MAGGGGRSLEVGAFGQYVLGERVGREGEHIECYAATQKLLDREVLIHVLRPSREANPTLFQRFLAGLERLSHVDAPGLLRVLDVDAVGARAFFTTLRNRAVPLREFAARTGGRVAPEKVIEFGIALAEGLAAIHAEGELWREIDLDTIFVDPDRNQAYLGVYPLGRQGELIEEAAALPLARLRAQPWDERTDVFLVGCALHEALAGAPPYPDLSGREAKPLRAEISDILPAGLEDALRAACRLGAGERPSAAELAAALKAVRAGKPIEVGAPPPKPPPAAKPRARERVRALAPEGAAPASGSAASGGALVLAGLVCFTGLMVGVRGTPGGADAEIVRAVVPGEAGPPEARAARETLETVARQVNVRETTARTFDSRWKAAQQAIRPGSGVTATDLLRLRLRHLGGDAGARAELDAAIAKVVRGQPEKPPPKVPPPPP